MARIRVREGKKGKTYQIIYTDPRTGAERCRSFASRKQAVAFQESVRSAATIHDRDTITVSQALDRWLSVCATVGRRGREPVESSTLKKYSEHAQIIRREIGEHRLSRLTPQSVTAFRDRILETRSRPYAKKFLTSLRAALNQAIDDGKLYINPAQTVSIHLSGRNKGDTSQTIPSIAQVRTLLKTADDMENDENPAIARAWARYRAFFYTLIFSGLRPGEALGLPWRDVDLDGKTIRVTQDANADGTIGRPKSAAGFRTIPMPDAAIHVLKIWRPKCPPGKEGLVFPNARGQVADHAGMTHRGWYPLQIRAGLVDRNGKPLYALKSLRHVRASMEIAGGATAKELQRLMGHADVRLTFNVYGHLFPDHADLRAARADEIAGILLGKAGQKTGQNHKD